MKRAYNGGCHSSTVRFECELDLAQGVSRCNGSISAKSRCWNGIAKAGEFRLLQSEEALPEYCVGSQSADGEAALT